MMIVSPFLCTIHGRYRIMKSVSMENVTGLLSPHNGNENYLKTVVSSLIGIGMDVRIAVLDSSRYVQPHFYVSPIM
jgi:site-specific DNA-cytosine methylase